MARVVLDVDISDIEIPKARKKKIDLDTDLGSQMLDSIKRQGILHPILLMPPASPGGKHRLVAGQFRLVCAVRLGHKTIPATIDDTMTEREAGFAYLAENLFRRGDKSATRGTSCCGSGGKYTRRR